MLDLTAVAQTVVFVASGSVALLADLVHSFGDVARSRWRSRSRCAAHARPTTSPPWAARQDPLIGLGTTLVMLHITIRSWRAVRGG